MNHKGFLLFSFVLIFLSIEVSYGTTPLESLIPKRELPEGWALFEGSHIYTEKTLFEHINGQAELFFKYGFQKSVFAIFQDLKSRERQIEMDIYDMGNVLHAFGIFSRFRNEDRPGGIGLDSSVDDHSAFFYKGKYFMMLYATEPDPDLLRRFSKIIASKISDPSPPPKEIGYFPKSGLKPGSIQYIPEGLLGHQFLNRGFQGTYMEKVEVEVKVKVEAEDRDKAKTEAKEFHLFLSIFKNSHDATMALKTYRGYLSKKGKIQLGAPASFDPSALKGEDPYKGQVIVVQKSFYLLGVVGFEKERYAENLLGDFVNSVK
jgi:hypothetical protein